MNIKMVKTYPIPCTKEEMSNLISASMNNDFYYLIFKLASKTGRRLGEYYDVQVNDIDLDKKVMLTKVLKRRKRVIKEALLDEELVVLLQRYIRQNKLKLDDYIFRKVSYRQIQYAVASYAKKAKIPHNVSFHNFRHYFITELFKQGLDYSKIAKLTGHSSPGTLVNYDHSVASDIRAEAIELIKNL